MKVAVVAPTAIPSRYANSIQVMKMTQAIAGLGYSVLLLVPTTKYHRSDRNSVEQRSVQPISPARESVGPRVTWAELSHHYGLESASYINGSRPAIEFTIEWLPANTRWRRYDYSVQAIHRARQWGADIIYTRLPQAAALSSQISIPTILETHDLPQGKVGPWLFRRFLTGQGAYRLVVITKALATDLYKHYHFPEATNQSETFTLIAADGVDLIRYANLPSPEQARQSLEKANTSLRIPECFTAGYTGHLYPGRGSEMLRMLAKRLPEVTFLITGGEPREVMNLSQQAKADELDNLILTGFIPNAELPIYQAACDVLLMPYQRRVAASSGGNIASYLSPMKVFEYMACGRPILSSDLPVLGEVLNSQNAILLPPEDLEAWICALQDLQTNPERRAQLSFQARSDAQQYSWESRAQKIFENLGIDK